MCVCVSSPVPWMYFTVRCEAIITGLRDKSQVKNKKICKLDLFSVFLKMHFLFSLTFNRDPTVVLVAQIPFILSHFLKNGVEQLPQLTNVTSFWFVNVSLSSQKILIFLQRGITL